MKFRQGDKVVFTGWTEAQVRWGGNDYPTHLSVGKCYVIESVDIHRQHTKVTLVGVTGRFNSVHFDYA